jgi:excinuclease ABC subunit C
MTKGHRPGPVDMPASVRRLPHGPGVYRFVDANNRVLYVGRAVDLRRRAASYWGGLGERIHLQRMVSAVVRVQAVVCASEHEAAWLERNLLEAHKPRANRSRGGQEVPMLIALSLPGAAPGLRAVHSPCPGAWRHFGPYLGGDRVRLALAGLHRAYPLPYARDGLSGSERDMGRVRGLTALSRPDLLRAISAVLARETWAVAILRSELSSHRDRAAAALAFELAGRVQDEMVAVDWLVSPQRVTTFEPYALDAYGWHEGLLVHFSVREGRLSTWRERPASARQAQRFTSATPEPWAAFAKENAVLAAKLAGTTGP